MSTGFLDKVLGTGKKQKSDIDDYKELDLSEYEGDFGGEPVQAYVRVAELTGLDDLAELKREIYNGNIILLNIASAKKDKLTLDRAIKDLKQVTSDVRGDVAMVGEDQILATPQGIKIDRKKIAGAKR